VDAAHVSELTLVSLAAMVSPTTLTFSVLALVLGDRPLRTGFWFFLGAFTATIAVGVVAAFVIGDVAAPSSNGTPKTWVSILDIVIAAILFVFAGRRIRRPVDPKTTQKMIAQMSKIASSPVIAVVGAGAMLANPGAFIPIALKTISETDPSRAQYIADWVGFTVVALLPLIVALILLLVARGWAEHVLAGARGWLERHAMTVGYAIVLLLGVALLRNGIAGLTA
jgi:Sap, sulfolipid-1-addressing protein